ncbi:hypothetical protein Gpo141_00005183, partial [Globisporangium polare]
MTTSAGNQVDDAALARVEARVTALVQSWGLSRFSEGMARQWLARSLSNPSDNNNNAEDPLLRL